MEEVIEELLNREKEFHLCEKEVNGFQFWQYERYYIDSFLRLGGRTAKSVKGSKRRILKYYLVNSDRIKKKQSIDICFIPHPRRRLWNGVYECIYTDAVAKKFPDAISLERLYERKHMEPIQSSNVVYMDRTVIEASLYNILNSVLRKRKKKKIAEQIYNELSIAMQGLLTEEQMKKIARKASDDYYIYKYSYRKLKKILARMKPKIVVEVVSYNSKCMVINEICKELGILTIELQHGEIGKSMLAYNYAVKDTIKQFPDKIYLFGDYYKRRARFPISSDHLISVGFPYFEREVQEYAKYKRRDFRYTIVFLSQGMYTKELADLAVALQSMIDVKGVRIIYKLHPCEYGNWRELHPMLEQSGIEVIGENGIPLYECFATSDVQVGVFSTAIYEGLGFHLRTFIFEQTFADRLQDLIDLGIVETVKSAEEIVEKIQIQDYKTYDIDYFWKRNALYNLEQALRAELIQVL